MAKKPERSKLLTRNIDKVARNGRPEVGASLRGAAMASVAKALALGFGMLVCHGAASAQDYPSRSITVIVPFPAGGPSDVVARVVTEAMGRTLGQTLVIENVGGAGGTIGSGRNDQRHDDGCARHCSLPVVLACF